MLRFDIITIFPDMFKSVLNESILKRAQEKKKVTIHVHDLREYTDDKKHRKVDDRPFGGGPGMVLMPGPVVAAIRSHRRSESHVIYLSPQGQKLDHKLCEKLAQHTHLILVCGHYEGVDQRIIDQEIDQEISIGDFVLTSGCPAALALIDATVRFLPGVLGHEEAAQDDSFQHGIFEGPAYTRPIEFEGMRVPDVLKSGNHKEIEHWRQCQGLKKTERVRPDLLRGNNHETVS